MSKRYINRSKRQDPHQMVLGKNFRGVLKINKDPAITNPNPPQFVGICRLENQEYWISGWRGPAKGTMVLIFQYKEPPGNPGEFPYQHNPQDVKTEEIPF